MNIVDRQFFEHRGARRDTLLARPWLLFLCAWLLMPLCAMAAPPTGSLRLSSYPEAVVADSISAVTLSAEVRGRDGKPLPDGTQIAFTTTLGTFREVVVPTQGGVARATLTSGSVSGIAVITATALGFGLVGETQVLFAKDQAELQAATDYVTVSAPDYLAYAIDMRVVAATGSGRKAEARYRFSILEADDLQLNCSDMTVIARNARLRYGPVSLEYEELSYSLISGQGFGTAEREGRWQTFLVKNGIEQLHNAPLSPQTFLFKDLSETQMLIKASHLWFYPNDKIQFRRADFYVGDVKALSMPLYSLSLWGNGFNNESLIGVQSGQFYVDVPYYYTLTPGAIGAVRLRTAQRSSRGFNTSKGWFLDLEHEYRGAQGSRGAFQFSSLARKDWGASWRHYQLLDPRTRAYIWMESPAHSGLLGFLQMNHQAQEFSVGVNLSASRIWEGSRARSGRADLFVDTKSKPVGDLPLRHNFSLTGSLSESRGGNLVSNRRQGAGLRSRWTLNPVSVGKGASLTGGLTVGRFVGNLSNEGWETVGTLSLTQGLGALGSVNVTYDYSQDPLSVAGLGRHRLSSSFVSGYGERFYSTIYLSRSLDVDSSSLLGDLSYRLSSDWRLGMGLTLQNYEGFHYRDYTFTIGYRLGYRELALTWSRITKRWSFDLLNTMF